MSIVSIVLNNRSFQLSCTDGDEEQLLNLVEKLSLQLDDVKAQNKMASFELLLVMLALGMQDTLHNMQNKIDKLENIDANPVGDEKFAETLITIAQYLENIAQKISK